MEKEFFVSKILLFGEYSIIKDSMALCMPYSLFDTQKLLASPKQQCIAFSHFCAGRDCIT